MKFKIMITLLLLAACTQTTETMNELPPIDAETCTATGGGIINPLDSDCPEGMTAQYEVIGLRCPCICCFPDQQEETTLTTPNNTLDEWAAWKDKPGVVVTISDGQMAAKTYLAQGLSVALSMSTPVKLTLIALTPDGEAHIQVNDMTVYLREGMSATFYENINIEINEINNP